MPYRKSVLPCVCKRWRSILYAPSPLLWGAVTLEPALDDRRPPGFRQVANWVKMRAPVRSSVRMHGRRRIAILLGFAPNLAAEWARKFNRS